MKKRILSLILALSMVLSVLPLGAFAEGSNQGLTIGSDGYPTASNGNGWSYDSSTEKLTLRSGTYDFSSTAPVQCAIHLSGATAKITGGTFAGSVTNGGTISGGTFRETCYVTNEFIGTISGGTFAGSVENRGTVTGGVFKRNATLTDVTGLHSITWDAASSKANIVAVNDVAANWAPYAYKGTTVTITASTEILQPERQAPHHERPRQRRQEDREIHHAGQGRGAQHRRTRHEGRSAGHHRYDTTMGKVYRPQLGLR